MEIKPTTSNTPPSLLFALCPPTAVVLAWLMLLTGLADGFDGLGQVMLAMTVAFFASLASLPALVISIQAVRSDDAHHGLATFATVGNALVTLQTATILLATAAYALFW